MRQLAAHFRMLGGTARLLLALKRPTNAAAPLLLAADAEALSSFRRWAVPARPALLIDPDIDLANPALTVHTTWILPKPPASEQLWRHPPGDWITRVPLPDRWQTLVRRARNAPKTEVTSVNQIPE